MAKDKVAFNQIINLMLNNNIAVEKVNLVNYELNITDIEHLCVAIEFSTITKTMGLSCNNINDKKMMMLSAALQKNNGLLELNLNDNNINNAGVLAINNAILLNPTISQGSFSLDLRVNLFDKKYAENILLLNNKLSLKNLNLNENDYGCNVSDRNTLYGIITRSRSKLSP